MLNIPPPIFTLAYVLIAAALSYLAGWPRVPGLPLVPLAVVLVAAGLALSVTAVALFRREDTEINPVSATNRKLVISGPYRFTRNPMVSRAGHHHVGHCFLDRGVADVSRSDRGIRYRELDDTLV